MELFLIAIVTIYINIGKATHNIYLHLLDFGASRLRKALGVGRELARSAASTAAATVVVMVVTCDKRPSNECFGCLRANKCVRSIRIQCAANPPDGR